MERQGRPRCGRQCRRKGPLNVHLRPGAEGRYLFAPGNKGSRETGTWLSARLRRQEAFLRAVEALYYRVVGNFFNHVLPLRIPDIARSSHSTRAHARAYFRHVVFFPRAFFHSLFIFSMSVLLSSSFAAAQSFINRYERGRTELCAAFRARNRSVSKCVLNRSLTRLWPRSETRTVSAVDTHVSRSVLHSDKIVWKRKENYTECYQTKSKRKEKRQSVCHCSIAVSNFSLSLSFVNTRKIMCDCAKYTILYCNVYELIYKKILNKLINIL